MCNYIDHDAHVAAAWDNFVSIDQHAHVCDWVWADTNSDTNTATDVYDIPF